VAAGLDVVLEWPVVLVQDDRWDHFVAEYLEPLIAWLLTEDLSRHLGHLAGDHRVPALAAIVDPAPDDSDQLALIRSGILIAAPRAGGKLGEHL
jgi:hypothetical protein